MHPFFSFLLIFSSHADIGGAWLSTWNLPLCPVTVDFTCLVYWLKQCWDDWQSTIRVLSVTPFPEKIGIWVSAHMKEDPPSHGMSEQGPGCTERSREYWFLSSKGQKCFCIHAWTSELQGFRFSRLGWKLFPTIFLGSGSGSLESERFHLYPKSFLSFLNWGEQFSLESPRKRKKAFETFQPFCSYHCSTPAFHWQCDQARDSTTSG